MTRTKARPPAIAVIGYGSQGHALARNWRDARSASSTDSRGESHDDVYVALPLRSKTKAKARRDGFRVLTVGAAVKRADIVVMAFPDYLHGRVFNRQIAPYLRRGQALVFLHGLSVHFGHVVPPRGCDVMLLAPHAPGVAVRSKFDGERDLSAFIAVAQNATGKAWTTLRRLATEAGFERSRCLKTTFKDEAIGDLFGEQAVLCGGLAMLIKSGFETLVEHGLPPENAYLEVAYQLDLIVDLIKRYGISGMFDRISIAARLGSASTGPGVIDDSVKRRMTEALSRIESGEFTRELAALGAGDLKRLKRNLKKLTHPALEKAARKFAPKG